MNGSPGKNAVRIAFGAVWLVDATLKWLPGFRSSYLEMLRGAAEGQPGWLEHWFRFWIGLLAPRATFFAFVLALTETLIAIALILGFARKLTYATGIAFSLLIWSTAEGFGGPYTAGSADIGTAIIYALVFASLLAMSAQPGSARYSVDAVIERKVSWWYRIAEVGHGSGVQQPLVMTPTEATAADEAAA
jgi:nitrite reductase (NO-forming)